MREYEKKAIREVMRKLRLKRVDNVYRYFKSGHNLSFEWDAAGISTTGSIVLIELELGEISEWHIQTHLCRIPIMIEQGTPVEKLVWVVDQSSFQSIKKQVNSWLTFFRSVSRLPLPNMEYRAPNGELLVERISN